MSGLYEADYDAASRFLRLKLEGLWDAKTVAAFAREMLALRFSVAAAGARDDRGRILLDLTHFAVQPPLIGSALGALLPQLGSRAGQIAVVLSASTVQRQQLRRLLASDKVCWFDKVVDAQTWLDQDG